MGIRFSCPNGHKLHVKENLAGKRGICPACGAKVLIPVAAAELPEPAIAVSREIAGTQNTAATAAPGPPSVVIPIVEPPATPIVAIPEPVVVRDAAPPVPEAMGMPIATAAPIAVAPPSPVSKYEAHRARVRRNRTTLAVVLLIAVIVLAGILIWILSGGPAPAQTSALAASPSILAFHPGAFVIRTGAPPNNSAQHYEL